MRSALAVWLYLGHRLTKQKIFMNNLQLISINFYLYYCYHRRMYIPREHYLDLLRQVETLTRDNQLLQGENSILAHALQEEKIRHYEIVQKLDWMEQQSKVLNAQLANQSEANHCDIKGQMSKLNAEHRKLIENKFSELQGSSFQKYKVLEIKNRVNRLENHDLTTFTDKLKKVYLSCSENREEPSLKDLVKWVKTLAKEKGKEGKEGKEAETSSSWKQNKKVKN